MIHFDDLRPFFQMGGVIQPPAIPVLPSFWGDRKVEVDWGLKIRCSTKTRFLGGSLG